MLLIASAAACYDLTPVPASDAGTAEDAGACAEDAAGDGCTELDGTGGSSDAGDASITDVGVQ